MTKLKTIDGLVSSLVEPGGEAMTNPRGTQFERYEPVIQAGATPQLYGAKGASLGSPGILPSRLYQMMRFSPDPNQQYIVNSSGVYVGGRPRSFGTISKDTLPDPITPGGTDYPDLGGLPMDGGGHSINGASGQDRWYEDFLFIPSDFVMPAIVTDPDTGASLNSFGVPAVAIDWHGETGPDPDDVQPLDAFGRPTRPPAIQFGQPVIQFHQKRLTAGAKQGFYVKMIGGRYLSQTAETYSYPNTRPIGVFQANHAYAADDLINVAGLAMRAKVAFTSTSTYNATNWTEVNLVSANVAQPSWAEGVASGNWVECSREYDLFPGSGDAPRGVIHYLRWHIFWSETPGVALLEVWVNDVKVVDSRSTPVATALLAGRTIAAGFGGANVFKTPSGHVQNQGHNQMGYYRPAEGQNSKNYYTGVWTQAYWHGGYLIASAESDLLGSGGVIDPGGGIDPPANTTPPSLIGFNIENSVLQVDPGVWTNDTSYAYQWKRDGVAINGATGLSYGLLNIDVGKTITCTVTVTNDEAESTSATTAGLVIIASQIVQTKRNIFMGINAKVS